MRRSWLVVVGLLAVLSGCTGTGPAGPEEIAPNPFAACPAGTPAPPAAGDLAPDVTLVKLNIGRCLTSAGALACLAMAALRAR